MARAGSILWLRRDLRRGDLPALGAAAEAAGDSSVLVLYVLDPKLWEGAGDARRAWLAATLETANEAYDGRLCLLRGNPRTVVPRVAKETGAGSVHVSRETTPAGRRRDEASATIRRRALGRAGSSVRCSGCRIRCKRRCAVRSGARSRSPTR